MLPCGISWESIGPNPYNAAGWDTARDQRDQELKPTLKQGPQVEVRWTTKGTGYQLSDPETENLLFQGLKFSQNPSSSSSLL